MVMFKKAVIWVVFFYLMACSIVLLKRGLKGMDMVSKNTQPKISPTQLHNQQQPENKKQATGWYVTNNKTCF